MTPDDKLRTAHVRPGYDSGAVMLGRVIIGTLACGVAAVVLWGMTWDF